MPSSFDTDPRSPSRGHLAVLGMCFVVIATAVVAALVGTSRGQFDRLVGVTASLVSVGDGLPAKSDVKFRGILVGFVSGVTPATVGQSNVVHIYLRHEFADSIPNTVTARVVPSNVFAVSSVQLVDHGPTNAALRPGAVIPEDTSLPTVLFQTTLNKIRLLLASVGRSPSDGVGALTALGQAVEGRGPKLREAAGDLNQIVAKLNTVVAPDTGPSTIAALAAAANGLKGAAPTLYDALNNAIEPARTLAEKRIAVSDLLSAGLTTTGTVRDAFDHQTDRLINISTQLTPVLGVFADHADQFHPIAGRFVNLGNKLWSVWDPTKNKVEGYGILSLTPFRPYVRADCPRYGDLLGPSCYNAPEVPTAPGLLSALDSMGFPPDPKLTENRPNLTPPRDSMRGAGGDMPPLPDVLPPPPGAAPPAPADGTPPPVAAPPAPADGSAPPQTLLPAETPPTAAQSQSAEIGSIGPTGSSAEKEQLSRIVGGPANAATVLMLAPLVRGTTVGIGPESGGNP
jgi:virulence factor Mce-like protein